MVGLIVLFLAVIFASGICSMAEAAILSLPFVRARILCEQKRRNAKTLLYIKENITTTVASIVIINNAINIIGSIFVGQLIALRFGNQWLGFASTVLTLTIIIAAEIIPKTIGERYKVTLSLLLAKPLRVLEWVLRPIVKLIVTLAKPFLQDSKLPKVTEDEIKMMLKLGRVAGTVEVDEEVLCNRVFKLNDLKAFQMMKPITQAYSLPASRTLEELKNAIIDSRFSRIVVYDKDPMDIVGIIQQRILLREIAKDNYAAYVRDFMLAPIFVHQLTKADALLEKFQIYNKHLFIVQDDRGENIGLVTMEDVLEELFGEIYDEKDIRPKKERKVKDN